LKTCICIEVLYEKRGGGLTIIIQGGGKREGNKRKKKDRYETAATEQDKE